MTRENTPLQHVKEWKDIHTPIPLTETEALRYVDMYEQGDRSFSLEEVASLYAMITYHRLLRSHIVDDDVAKQFLMKAKENVTDFPVVRQLDEWFEITTFQNVLRNIRFTDLILHEADHLSTKRKKMQLIEERLETLEEEWTEATPYRSRAQSESFLEAKQHARETIDEALAMIEPYQADEMNGINHIATSDMNAKLRELEGLVVSFNNLLPAELRQDEANDALDELNRMIGLDEIKQYIHRYYHYLKYQQTRKQLGFQMMDEQGLHMIITGNPGTGKTTIARLLASIYHELGLLDTKEVVEVNRSHLVGSYVGQSEENTMNYIRQAQGGVLFIDEAYSLKREGQSGNDYGQAVIDTIVSAMTSKEYGGKFAVILAGYPEEMRQFLFGNPGLRSRFPEQNHIELPDYGMNELVEIAEQVALMNDYFFTGKALNEFRDAIEQMRVDDTFGNARTVKNLIMQTIFRKGAKKEEKERSMNWLDYMRIGYSDVNNLHADDTEHASPTERLNELVGLTGVKEEVRKLSSFVHMQQVRKQQSLPTVPIQLHSVFSGNPGTGKTTVAHIYASILKENGLLKRGHVVVASRSDLVAGYVGQTAPKTKKKIREALGGVLFIDEAYALNRSGSNDFGKEAIDTLVDEMTKHNENLVVILAGYENEMRALIRSNPGLASRFKKFFHFEDYSSDELLQMVHVHAEEYGFKLQEEAVSALQQSFQEQEVEGNGRFIKNLLDEAIQYQALRMMNDEDTTLDLTLSQDDFEKAWNTVKGREQ
ncbi:stage V sporulation protein K [Pontibacillus halophilus JSM 076056 = DSM 19796]|uniref:Stage V sporulation protein K n=1 Tax=Pontibacillus halophilus JSM 076056 = DSM 19796 TaxID=1385510 RepID=A0A0A5GLG6_9BACI|nr:AAA family ATPase [Pontibacillus halophilus]KGX92048.1 stage V sporulation protein K [Pontibacillus halophilus JSM 076056 = DSM 19796]